MDYFTITCVLAETQVNALILNELTHEHSIQEYLRLVWRNWQFIELGMRINRWMTSMTPFIESSLQKYLDTFEESFLSIKSQTQSISARNTSISKAASIKWPSEATVLYPVETLVQDYRCYAQGYSQKIESGVNDNLEKGIQAIHVPDSTKKDDVLRKLNLEQSTRFNFWISGKNDGWVPNIPAALKSKLKRDPEYHLSLAAGHVSIELPILYEAEQENGVIFKLFSDKLESNYKYTQKYLSYSPNKRYKSLEEDIEARKRMPDYYVDIPYLIPKFLYQYIQILNEMEDGDDIHYGISKHPFDQVFDNLYPETKPGYNSYRVYTYNCSRVAESLLACGLGFDPVYRDYYTFQKETEELWLLGKKEFTDTSQFQDDPLLRSFHWLAQKDARKTLLSYKSDLRSKTASRRNNYINFAQFPALAYFLAQATKYCINSSSISSELREILHKIYHLELE